MSVKQNCPDRIHCYSTMLPNAKSQGQKPNQGLERSDNHVLSQSSTQLMDSSCCQVGVTSPDTNPLHTVIEMGDHEDHESCESTHHRISIEEVSIIMESLIQHGQLLNGQKRRTLCCGRRFATLVLCIAIIGNLTLILWQVMDSFNKTESLRNLW